MRKWRPIDYIIVLFSFVICLGLVGIGVSTMFFGLPITDHRSRMVETALSSVFSIISMYVGAQIQKKRDED